MKASSKAARERGKMESKKKILIITNHSYMLWRFRKELIETLMQEHEVVLSMPFVGHEDDFQAMGLRCIETEINRRGINPATDLKLFKFYGEMLKAEKPDLVVTYSIKPNIYAGLQCCRLGITYCANVQGLGTAFQKKGLATFVTVLYRTAFSKVRTVFFENEENAAEFRRRSILSEEKQTILHGAGINLDDYPYEAYPVHDKFHFLYLGRIMREKGIDELFAAMERLKSEFPAAVLDLVGFFEDEYKDRVDDLVNRDIAVFHGFQQDPKPYYKGADCVVLPSYHEGMSNVLLEAAAIGRPVITSDIPGCREAVTEGETGFLVRVKDVNDLYEKMKKMISIDRNRRKRMGMLGREKMEREFDKEMVVRDTVQALFRER